MIRTSADVVPPRAPASAQALLERRCLVVSGLVQGVGFRPFVYRLATELGLSGWVKNTPVGVCVEVEGEAGAIDELARRLRSEPPPNAVIRRVEMTAGAAVGVSGFSIEPSDAAGAAESQVPQDLAPCRDCTAEVFDPGDRLYRYPFATCTQCGPRFTIIQSMPYDRAHTTMASFALCAECRRDYEDPMTRRFHAQAVACAACGPQLALWDTNGRTLSSDDDALREAADAIRRGLIVAVKGVGGFHLMADASNDAAVRELRRRKQRPDKPFAVLCGSLDVVRSICRVGDVEASLLRSAQAPIVILPARRSDVAPSVAPGNPHLGVMLPPSLLHLLLMHDLRTPVVATSGNRSDEPICTREHEAVARFRDIADLLLVHDRPIARHADDSVVRVIAGEGVVLRLGRGYAPLAVPGTPSRPMMLAVGGGHKNAVAVVTSNGTVLSQHVGSLANPDSRVVFHRTAADLAWLHGVSPDALVCDLHPDDPAAPEARAPGRAMIPIQHHHAHIVSCMAEHELDGPVLGVAWDGTGYGTDGTIWGGEFLVADRASWRRIGHLRRFRLPGADHAVREPRRSALGVLFELFGTRAIERTDLAPVASFSESDRAIMGRMLGRGINSPVTSSAGRLFDAVSALIGIRQITTFEGQAAMELEFAAEEIPPHLPLRKIPPSPLWQRGVRGDLPAGDRGESQSTGEPYPIEVMERGGVLVVDWGPTILAIVDDLERGVPASWMARAFHDALVDAIVAVAQRAGQERVVLTGGCFQNRYLTERALDRLVASGFRVYRHRSVPPNDGGLALGQGVAASRQLHPPPSPPPQRGRAREGVALSRPS
ncbi:MAG: carbamoyltransferase HypF [Nitrospirota bacterium]